MIKLNRTSEYGLIALRHMSKKAQTVTSAREVAEAYGLPFEITAKTLLRLKDSGMIQSAQGARGGYTLSKPLHEVTLAEFLRAMEGPQAVVACVAPEKAASCECDYHARCGMRDVMSELDQKVRGFLSTIRLSDLEIGRAHV